METPVLFQTVFLFLILSLTAIGFRRLFFHPLHRFPGPRLAALTELYVAYYDVIRDGGLLEQLEKLHAVYGPVVRIAPGELHFSDPRAYATIYAPGSKFTKHAPSYNCLCLELSVFGAVDPKDWKTRQEVMSPLFSRRAILKPENVVQEKVSKLISKLISAHTSNLFMAFRSTSLDIITAYSFSPSQCADALDDPTFHLPLLESMESSITICWLFKAFPLLQTLMMEAPSWLPAPAAKHELMKMRERLAIQIDAFSKDPGALDGENNETIFHHLLAPHRKSQNGVPPSRRSLIQEGQLMVVAGSDTVGNALLVGAVHVLGNKAIHKALVGELDEAWNERELGYQQLEKLPYLTAVIKESLRMSHGVVTPLRRVTPADVEIAGNRVPAGTVVSIAASFVHNNADIFPEPERFDPERWLAPEGRELENYLVAFSKGPRSCIGINLAWCELYLIFGNIFRKLELELLNTDTNDLKFREYFMPFFVKKDIQASARKRSI